MRIVIPFFRHVSKREQIQAARLADKTSPGSDDVLAAHDPEAKGALGRNVALRNVETLEEENESGPVGDETLHGLSARFGKSLVDPVFFGLLFQARPGAR